MDYQTIIPVVMLIVAIVFFIVVRIYLLSVEAQQDVEEKDLASIAAEFGYAYDEEQDIFYTILNAWQRQYGYCKLYDESAQGFNMVIDCEPIYFKYDGRYWLIEFWKGQYGITSGCEVGVYVADVLQETLIGGENNTVYNAVSDDELFRMKYVLKRDGETYFKREDTHWWLTGFRLGDWTSPSQLSMYVSIELKDMDMLKAFVTALEDVGYVKGEYYTFGKSVTIKYDTPKSKQPRSRGKIKDKITLTKCKILCNLYNKVAEKYPNVDGKLLAMTTKDFFMLSRIIYITNMRNLNKK